VSRVPGFSILCIIIFLGDGNVTECKSSCCRTVENVVAVHKVNVVGPMIVTQALLPLLRKGNKKVVSPLIALCLSQIPSYTVCRQYLPAALN
jgi:NAD(P)-dependent dehydrogenase (short-subunit alcohol dehydrogenase family)